MFSNLAAARREGEILNIWKAAVAQTLEQREPKKTQQSTCGIILKQDTESQTASRGTSWVTTHRLGVGQMPWNDLFWECKGFEN